MKTQKKYTAFTSYVEIYQCEVMPFGLCNSGAIFFNGRFPNLYNCYFVEVLKIVKCGLHGKV